MEGPCEDRNTGPVQPQWGAPEVHRQGEMNRCSPPSCCGSMALPTPSSWLLDFQNCESVSPCQDMILCYGIPSKLIRHIFLFLKKKIKGALAGVAQWIEHGPSNQSVTSSTPSQGTRLGCRPGPPVGGRERQPHTDVSFPLFFLPFPSL